MTKTKENFGSSVAGGLSRRRVLGGAAALGGAYLVGPGLMGTAHGKTPGTVVFGLSSYPPGMHPWENKGTASSTVKNQLFRGLTSYTPDGRLRPELAESWEIPDAKTYIFKLRDNAYFHDGEKVTSADVKYTFEAMRAKDSTAFLRAQLDIVASIETPDARTVKITLKEPNVTFILLTAIQHAHIVSAKSAAKDPKNLVGAGPYKITSIERGTRIEMEAFDKYYKPGLPKTKKLKFVAYKDENLRVAALEAGDVDIIEYVPWQSMDAVAANKNLDLDITDGPFMYLLFNTEKGPFTNVKLRQAVAYAVQRSDVIDGAFFGRGAVLGSVPVPKGSEYYEPKFAGFWKYDVAKAKALMAEAGYPNGFSATLLSTGQYGMHKNTAEVVQQNLAQIGINAKLNLPDWATRIQLGNKGQYDFAVMGSAGDYNDPDALTVFVDGSQGPSFIRSFGFSDDGINKLLDSGRQELDKGKRKAIYDNLQRKMLELAPIVPLNWRAQGYATQTYVSGFKNIPGFLTFYSGYTIEDVEIR